MRKPHVLTRSCPHRWCPLLHRALLTEGVVLVVALSLHQLGFLAYALALAVLVPAVSGIVSRRTLADAAAEDHRMVEPEDVRPGWANLAAGLDVAIAVVGVLVIALVLHVEHNAMLTSSVDQGLTTPVVSTMVAVVRSAAHFLATRPRRRIRVLVPTTN